MAGFLSDTIADARVTSFISLSTPRLCQGISGIANVFLATLIDSSASVMFCKIGGRLISTRRPFDHVIII